MNLTYADLAKMIDHSLLNPALTAAELKAGCHLALEYDVASVCILPYYLKRCADILRGSAVTLYLVIEEPLKSGHSVDATVSYQGTASAVPTRKQEGLGLQPLLSAN